MSVAKLVVLFCVLISLIAHVSALKYLPAFSQCGQYWSNDIMSPGSTICMHGCLMSSVALSLHSRGIPIRVGHSAQFTPTNPRSFNNFLRFKGGYLNGTSLFIHGIVNAISSHTNVSTSTAYYGSAGQISAAAVQAHLNADRTIVANVERGGHWVLVESVSGNNIIVKNSSGPNSRKSYTIWEVSSYSLYNIRGPKSVKGSAYELEYNDEGVEVEEFQVEDQIDLAEEGEAAKYGGVFFNDVDSLQYELTEEFDY